MKQEIFDEVDHWLKFIKIWEQENEDEVPEQILLALENALEKAICFYREQNKSVDLEKMQNNSLH